MAYLPIGGMSKTELKQLREEVGLTREKLASILKVSKSTIESWEQGRRAIPMIKVAKIVEAIGVDRNVYAERKEKKRLEAREGRQKVCFEFEVPGGWAEDFSLAYDLLSSYVKKYLMKNGIKEKDITEAMIFAVVKDGRSITGPDACPDFAQSVAYYTIKFAPLGDPKKADKMGDEARAKFAGIQLPRFSEYEDDE